MRYVRLFPALAVGLLVGGATAQAEDLAPRLGGKSTAGIFDTGLDPPGDGGPVRISAAIEPGAKGRPDVLAVTATLEPGWHLYSLTQPSGGPLATKISIAADSGRRPAGPFVPTPEPDRRTVENVPAWKGLPIEEHAGTVTWRATLEAGAGDAVGSVMVQLCRDDACLPPETLPFTAAGSAAASGGAGLGGADPAEFAAERSHARVRAEFHPSRPGSTARVRPLRVEVLAESGWHVYPASSSAAAEIGQGRPTIVSISPASSARVTEVTSRGGKDAPLVIELAIAAAPGAEVDALVGFQTCSDTACDLPAAVRLVARVPEADGRTSAGIRLESAPYAEAARSPATIASASAAGPVAVAAVAPGAKTTPVGTPLSLPAALAMGLLGGLLLNLMPCVLPVLGLKLMSFAQQSGRARREVFEMNLWYCAGIFAVFFALATASVAANIGLAGSNLAWGEQFTSATFNVTMVGIVFAFALSFLGVWELPIPGFIGEQAGHLQSREGPAGSFLKGALGTVLATPCSGPFLGPVFGFTLTQPTGVTYAVFAAIATGMALPYIVVGLVPGLVRFLPRPGPWMLTFKEVLGFVMLGTVAYLFTFLHHDWFVPTFVLLIGIWMACWWIGRGQEAAGVVGFGRWVQAAVMATAVGTASFLLLGPTRSVIEWEQPFTRARLAELRGSGATVMVDFSADWCPTCKVNLAFAIETSKVGRLIARNRVVPLLADWTDGSPEIKQMLESLGSRSIPVLAIFPPAAAAEPIPEPIVLRDLITEAQVLEALERAGPSRGVGPEIRAARAGGPSSGL